jgi:DNA-binding SARP family transcriptional activator
MISPVLKQTCKFSFVLMFCCLSLLAQQTNRVALPDSVRKLIRLRSHLLVDPAKLVPGQLGSLLEKQIPVAFRVSGEMNEELHRLIALIPKDKLPVVVILEGKAPLSGNDFQGTIVLNDDDLDKVNLPGNVETLRKQFSCKEFLLASVNSDSIPSPDFFIGLWEHTGKMPNFIQVNPSLIDQCINLIDTLNSQKVIFGEVRDNGHLLAEVSWKDLPDRKTNGYFSFPVNLLGSSPLLPYKAGYQFSPDIILPSPENLKNPKVFNAVKLNANFGMTDHFTFSNKVRNLKRQNDEEIIPYNMLFVRDKNNGKCAFFSGKAYVDGGLRSRSALKPNFSITAWIKPAELGANNCILGKGKDFVLKIHRGELTFTVQGVKDYYSVKTPVPLNQWSFIGLVHTSADNYISFYLNGKLTEKISLLTPYVGSDYTMLVGSNLWEEYFVGYMKEIKIWDRELNEEEIRNEYLAENARELPVSMFWIPVLILFLSFPGFYLWRRFIRKKQVSSEIKPEPVANQLIVLPLPEGPDYYREQINCFGGLRVISADQKDVSKKFSPKIKQLFVLILLHSIGGRKGISSKEMSDCLWPGMSPQNAKNIRGTNIQNLKALLSGCSGIKLVFQDKLWLLKFADGYFIDYALVENWLNDPEKYEAGNRAERLPELLSILKKGTLFPDLGESWIDTFIDRMSNRIIEYGRGLFHTLSEEKYDGLLLAIAEVISINDPLNEPALRKKISIHTRQGKLGLAHSVFDSFTKLYFELYQEKYPGDFKSLVSGEALE